MFDEKLKPFIPLSDFLTLFENTQLLLKLFKD
jgi:hypothetical protein